MVGKSLGYWVGGKSWAAQRLLTRAPEKEKGIAQESIECYSSRGAVLGLKDGRHAVTQCHITGMGAKRRIGGHAKQTHPSGNYGC